MSAFFHVPGGAPGPLHGTWEWLWQAPTLPASVAVGGFVAVAAALSTVDRELLPAYLRTSLTAAGMGVFTNLVLSSLPPEGDHWMIVPQRALAPVILGAAAYWFLAGFTAAPEYSRAREALRSALLGRRDGGGGNGKRSD
jgi:hypothetical protein